LLVNLVKEKRSQLPLMQTGSELPNIVAVALLQHKNFYLHWHSDSNKFEFCCCYPAKQSSFFQ